MSIIDPGTGPETVQHHPGEDGFREGGYGEGGGRRRYLRVFKHLRRGELATIEHGMGTQPLVDVYELERFQAAVSADEMVEPMDVHFYLYHHEDATVRVKGDGGLRSITVDPRGGPSFRIPLREALREAGVEVNAGTHLGDIAVEFWKAFFSPPSDPFDEESYANSRWFDRDVGDRRSLEKVQTGGGWDDLWLMYRPRKSLSSAAGAGISREWVEVFRLIANGDPRSAAGLAEKLIIGGGERGGAAGAPPGVEVTHLGQGTVGLRLLDGGPDRVAVMALLRA